jgi:hypothetical protein
MVHQSLTDETEFLSFLGGEIEDGYEEEELQHIHQILKSPCFYYMEFYRFSFFKEIVRYLNNRFILMVDDDRGHIYDASTFLKLENW